jgi:hypothetical protein
LGLRKRSALKQVRAKPECSYNPAGVFRSWANPHIHIVGHSNVAVDVDRVSTDEEVLDVI